MLENAIAHEGEYRLSIHAYYSNKVGTALIRRHVAQGIKDVRHADLI